MAQVDSTAGPGLPSPVTQQTEGMAHQLILTRWPYLDMATHQGINIHWRTNGNSNSLVRYGSSPNNLSESIFDSALTKNHSITLNGLANNFKYYYAVGSLNETLQGDSTHYFFTAPATNADDKIRFWVTGDFGQAGPGQSGVAQAFFNYNANRKINGWLWLGDNAYNSGTETEYQNNIFSIFHNRLKHIPLFPAPGNHDYGNYPYQSPPVMTCNFPYFSIFDLPLSSGTEKYYSYNYGNAHFISLDSYGAFNYQGSEMYNWLLQDLNQNKAKWTIVYFHHPPYSKGTHDSDTEQELIDMRNNIVPLLETFNVDLVLCGHSHVYERSFFMKGHFGLEADFNTAIYPQGNIIQQGSGPYVKTSLHPEGTIYVVNGSGSKSSSWMQPGYPHNAMIKSIENKSGSLLLEMEADTLKGTFVQSDGIIGDEFMMIKKNTIAAGEKSTANNITLITDEQGGLAIRFKETEEYIGPVEITILDSAGRETYHKQHQTPNETSKQIYLSKNEIKISHQPGVIIISRNGQKVKAEKILFH